MEYLMGSIKQSITVQEKIYKLVNRRVLQSSFHMLPFNGQIHQHIVWEDSHVSPSITRVNWTVTDMTTSQARLWILCHLCLDTTWMLCKVKLSTCHKESRVKTRWKMQQGSPWELFFFFKSDPVKVGQWGYKSVRNNRAIHCAQSFQFQFEPLEWTSVILKV